jgi:hypothetical protein
MSTKNHIPATVEARLDARLTPFRGPATERAARLGLINDLKLLFAALGAGGTVVPLGDNSRTARMLSEYAASLRSH